MTFYAMNQRYERRLFLERSVKWVAYTVDMTQFWVLSQGGGGGDTLILDRGYSLAKLPRFFEGAEKLG